MTGSTKIKYKFTAKDATKFNKYGIDLVIYGENVPSANVVHVHTDEGHFEEFYSTSETYIYYIVRGQGIFFLNDERIEAKETDLIVIPPKTRIHYFGKLDMVLTVAPAYDDKNQRHVRMVDKSENPFTQK